jgi:hypothetical protein
MASSGMVIFNARAFSVSRVVIDRFLDVSFDMSCDVSCDVSLDVSKVRALPDPGGQARCLLAIACDGKIYTADIATKALRKAKSTISTNGAENVFAMVQGKLRGNEITECGLVAQVKTPKPAVEAA